MRNYYLTAIAGFIFLATTLMGPVLRTQSSAVSNQLPAPGQSSAEQNQASDSLVSAPASGVDNMSREANPGDPLLDVTPLPKGKVTIEGATVAKIDPIRNR